VLIGVFDHILPLIGSCSNAFNASSIQEKSSTLILTFCHFSLSSSRMMKTINKAEVSLE
jgi:hypothetical protein